LASSRQYGNAPLKEFTNIEEEEEEEDEEVMQVIDFSVK